MIYPQYFTLGQAAKATGKSKPTISKYISEGKISVISKDKSGYKIEPSELFRVFTPLQEEDCKSLQSLTPEIDSSNSVLQKEIDLLRDMLSDKDNVIGDLRERLDGETAERRKLTMMITDMNHKPVEPSVEKNKGGFWAKLMGV